MLWSARLDQGLGLSGTGPSGIGLVALAKRVALWSAPQGIDALCHALEAYVSRKQATQTHSSAARNVCADNSPV